MLIISGSMGAGKTSVLAEASDLLANRRIVHAAIDLDALALAYLPSADQNDSLMYGNLASVCKNYAAAGATRLLLARALENRSALELIRRAVCVQETLVCRLTAPLEIMEARVLAREKGILQQNYVTRVAELNDILDRAQLEDFAINTENRSLTQIAHELLIKAKWITP